MNCDEISDLEKLMLSQNVNILVGNGTSDDPVIPIDPIRFNHHHPKTRINHGMSRTYVFGSCESELSFVFTITKESLACMRRRLGNFGGVRPTSNWTLNITTNDGNIEKFMVEVMVLDLHLVDDDGQQRNMECTVRVLGTHKLPAASS